MAPGCGSSSAVWKWLDAGELPHVTVGRRVRILRPNRTTSSRVVTTPRGTIRIGRFGASTARMRWSTDQPSSLATGGKGPVERSTMSQAPGLEVPRPYLLPQDPSHRSKFRLPQQLAQPARSPPARAVGACEEYLGERVVQRGPFRTNRLEEPRRSNSRPIRARSIASSIRSSRAGSPSHRRASLPPAASVRTSMCGFAPDRGGPRPPTREPPHRVRQRRSQTDPAATPVGHPLRPQHE